MTSDIIINVSNIRAGGGVQVASSFVSELDLILASPQARPWLQDVLVHASTPVLANIGRPLRHVRYLHRDAPPLQQLAASATGRSGPAVTFNLFGPTYQFRRDSNVIAGFADGTSLRPDQRSPRTWLRQRLSRRYFTHQVDTIIVEAPQVALDLSHQWGIDRARIRVVPNVLNATLRDHPPSVRPNALGQPLVLAYPTRLYPHKNLSVLGQAAAHLEETAEVDVRFLLTLTPDEWSHLDPLTQRYSTTAGSVATEDLPSFYQKCHGVVFPSLNESFSATPLEAHHFKLPLVASDRDFVRNISRGNAFYFEPTDPVDLARAIVALTRTPAQELAAQLDAARSVVDGWTTARERAEMYLDIIEEHLAR